MYLNIVILFIPHEFPNNPSSLNHSSYDRFHFPNILVTTAEDIPVCLDFLNWHVKPYFPYIVHEQYFKNIKTKSCIYPL